MLAKATTSSCKCDHQMLLQQMLPAAVAVAAASVAVVIFGPLTVWTNAVF